MALRVLLAMTVVMMLAGCGSDSPSSVPPPPPEVVVPAGPIKGDIDLQGEWRSKCIPGKLDGLVATIGIGITQMTEITIKEDAISERTLVTSDACEGGDIEITTSGTYESNQSLRSGVRFIDMKLGSYRVKPITEFGKRVLNLAKFCEIDSWKIGIARTISVSEPTQGCLPLPRVRTVYSIENERLYFGFDREVAADGPRQTDLRRDWYFSK